MKKRLHAQSGGLVIALVLSLTAGAAETTNVPMRQGGATTFYIEASVGDLAAQDFMVDTGSGYMTINEITLAELQQHNQAHYQGDLRGVLANGSEILVPLYRVSQLAIGGCLLQNVDAAVFPGKTRQILGLNALRQAGTFTFSFNPPQLQLGNCPQAQLLADAAAVAEPTPVAD